MNYQEPNVNNQTITSSHLERRFLIFKNITLVLGVIILIASSFGSGFYVAGGVDDILKKEFVSYDNFSTGIVLDKYKNEEAEEKIPKDVDFNLFWQVWDTLRENYVDQNKISEKEMFYGAIKGMVDSVGDPYTVFMDPKISKEFEDDLAGTFEGIGAEIGIKNEILTIIAPLPDMPAELAGLKAGDKVLAINGTSTLGISIDEAVNKIRGPKDTEVTLTISRKDIDGVKDIVIKRGKIIVKSIKTTLRDDKIFVLEISNFNDDTEELFNNAVQEIIKTNPKGIILDLRNNPGGYLDTSIEVASRWIEDGVIVSEKFSEDNKNDHNARGKASLKDFKTVVLVNEGSASASEIVAGALQDYEKAKIIGKKTYGKGSVQSLKDFEDGSSIKITIAKWLTPKGRSINDEGIMPDEEVEYTKENYQTDTDPQMDKAIEILN